MTHPGHAVATKRTPSVVNAIALAPEREPVTGECTELPFIHEDYQLTNYLGRGGCASVYEAQHREYGLVAVKVSDVVGGLASEADMRLIREAVLAQRVTSPHVVRVLDLGTLKNGAPYIVMERLFGEDLHATLQRLGRLSVGAACAVMHAVLSGLEAVHEAGIIHRDLKPSNVVLHVPESGGAPRVKLIDFGVARSDQGTKLTRTGTVVGTACYLSPEQAGGREIDGRVDVWAAGVLFYELLVGETPFERLGVQETLASILFADIPKVQSSRHDVPEGVARVIEGALERELDERFASAASMRIALEEAMVSAGFSQDARWLDELRTDHDWDPEKLSLAPTLLSETSFSGIRVRPTRPAWTKDPRKRRAAWAVLLAVATCAYWAALVLALKTSPVAALSLAAVTVTAPKGAGVTSSGAVAKPMAIEARAAASPAAEASAADVPGGHATSLTPTALLMLKHAEALTTRGDLALARGDYDAAYGHFDSATTLDPTSEAAWRGFGTAAYQLGRSDEAWRARRRANELAE